MPAIPLTDKFIPAFNFQEVLVDKTTGFPLAKGIVTFYQDAQRTVLKDIFQLTGSPGNYTVTQLPNPITLSTVGTFQDNSGNDIVPYFYPYDILGQPEFYYVTVYSSLDGITPAVLQFTRENVPFLEDQSGNAIALTAKNYIPDGQFLIHNNVLNITNDSTFIPGKISAAVTTLAPNGWTFERDVGSTSIDTVNFIRIPITNIPVGNPRYAVNVTCVTPGGSDTFKYLSVSFADVNKFANDNTYTFAFSAKAIGSPGIVSIKVRKNYGSGGSAEEIIDIGLTQITTSEQMYNFSFSLGSNVGKNLGTTNTDFVSFMISFLPNQAFEFQFTDFILANGNVTFNSFPVTTNSEFAYETLGGSLAVPNYNAADLYLPIILTPSGLIYDHSQISNLVLKTIETLEIGELWADGASYLAEGFSSDGIPYSRLADKWFFFNGSDADLYRYGSGLNFVTMYTISPGVARLSENSVGAVTVASDGAIPTGFSFTTIQAGDPTHQYVVEIGYVAASAITPGAYWIFYGIDAKKYYVWYQKDGVGADPHVSGAEAGILIPITATDTAEIVSDNTQYWVNHKYFATPDYRGYFPRFWSAGAGTTVDPDSATRAGATTGKFVLPGNYIGTFQVGQNLSHVHTYNIPDIASDTHGAGTSMNIKNTLSSHNTGSEGGSEARSTNMYVGAAIKY